MTVSGAFSFTGNTDRVVNRLNNMVNRQLPWAMVTTLNGTGKVLVSQNRIHMKQKLTKANRFTLNAYYFQRASKMRPQITVSVKMPSEADITLRCWIAVARAIHGRRRA